jgi:hypothetical protein
LLPDAFDSGGADTASAASPSDQVDQVWTTPVKLVAAIDLALACGIGVALYLNSVIALLKFAIVLLVIWGVPITLIFLWRRLTEMAVRVQVLATVTLVAVIPWSVPAIPALARSATLTQMTREQVIMVSVPGNSALTQPHRIEPVSIYFEEGVVRSNPQDLQSTKTGKGLFRIEVYLLAVLGVDVAGFNPAQLLMTRYLVDALLPLLILIVVSLLTAPTDPARVARFHARTGLRHCSGCDLGNDRPASHYRMAGAGNALRAALLPGRSRRIVEFGWGGALGNSCGLDVAVPAQAPRL